MSAEKIHQYFDLEEVKNNYHAYHSIVMENGFRASIERWNVSGNIAVHLIVQDRDGKKLYQNHVSSGSVESDIKWANSEINRNFPRKEVLLGALKYQEELIKKHKAILDSVGCELSCIDTQ